MVEKFIIESDDEWYTDVCGAVSRAVYEGLRRSKRVEVSVKELEEE